MKTTVALIVCLLLQPSAVAVGQRTGEQISYEQHVRPILKTHCFHCHGEGAEIQGGLDLRLRRLIARGGDSGPAVAAAKPADSLLLQRVREGEMPPEDVALRLTDAEVASIAQWIAAGAPAKYAEPDDLDPASYITQEERSHWAFQPVRRPEVPAVAENDRVRTPIDRFLLAKLESGGLQFSPDAAPAALARRACFDLTGLPISQPAATLPTTDSPAAYERLLDQLLGSARYGERWGRHWLDVAGYADSEGYTADDPVRPDAYQYRDYVIRAFNTDKPWDEFIVEQLAGDELLQPPFKNLTPAQAKQLIATGFLRMAPDGTAAKGVDQSVARNEVIAKTIDIVSTSLLGLTVGCAQCHNHRYDPISQADYFRLRAIFEPSLDWKNWRAPPQRRVSLYTDADRQQAAAVEAKAKQVLDQRSKKQQEFIEATFEKQLAKLDDSLRAPIRLARQTPVKQRTPAQAKLLKEHPSVNVTAGSLYLYDRKAADELKKLQDRAAAIRATKPQEQFVRAVWEPAGKQPPQTFLFVRGDHEQPQQPLPPAELTVLASADSPPLPVNDPALPTSGRRLAYARWLTSGGHPLVARVLVNRIWLHHFGRGLVSTPADFGALGSQPSHPQLLDWLAAELVDSGWSAKHLHRLIMTSTAYRQSSQRHAAGDAADPENELYWRMPLRRLEAEVLRDAMLAVGDDLNLKAFGPPVPVMADKVGQFVVGKENLNAGRPGAVLPMHGEDHRRSIYIQSRRSRPLSVMSPFDLPRMEPNCAVRNASTVSPQSLMLMNSPFASERAARFARRVIRDAGDDISAQVELAWRLAYASAPDREQLAAAVDYIKSQTEHFAAHPAADGKAPPQQEALASFCHALLSSNRFLYID